MEFTQVLLSESSEEVVVKTATERIPVGSLEIGGSVHTLYNRDNKIGRDDSCNIVIKSNVISSEHAVIEAEDETHLLYDLSSTNKTKLGKLTLKPFIRYVINDGDQILFGNVLAVYKKANSLPSTPEKANTSSADVVTIIPETPEKDEDVMCVIPEMPHKNEDYDTSQKSDMDIFDNNGSMVKDVVNEDIYDLDTLNFDDDGAAELKLAEELLVAQSQLSCGEFEKPLPKNENITIEDRNVNEQRHEMNTAEDEVEFAAGYFESETQQFINETDIAVITEDYNKTDPGVKMAESNNRDVNKTDLTFTQSFYEAETQQVDNDSLKSTAINTFTTEKVDLTFTQGFYEAETQPIENETVKRTCNMEPPAKKAESLFSEGFYDADTEPFTEKVSESSGQKTSDLPRIPFDSSPQHSISDECHSSKRKMDIVEINLFQTEDADDKKENNERADLTFIEGFYEAETQPVAIENVCTSKTSNCHKKLETKESVCDPGLKASDVSFTEGFYEAETQPVVDGVLENKDKNRIVLDQNKDSYMVPTQTVAQLSTEEFKVRVPEKMNSSEQLSSLNAEDTAFAAAEVLMLSNKTSETLIDIDKSLNFYEAMTQPVAVECGVSVSNNDANEIVFDKNQSLNPTQPPTEVHGDHSSHIPNQLSSLNAKDVAFAAAKVLELNNKTSETLEVMDKSLNYYEAATQPVPVEYDVSVSNEYENTISDLPPHEIATHSSTEVMNDVCVPEKRNTPDHSFLNAKDELIADTKVLELNNKTSETLGDMDKSLNFYEAATQPAEIDNPVCNETELPAGENSKNVPKISTNITSETLQNMDKSINFYEAATQPVPVSIANENTFSDLPPHETETQTTTNIIKEAITPENRNVPEQLFSLNAKDVTFAGAEVLSLNNKTSSENMDKSLNFYEAATEPVPVEYDVSVSNEDAKEIVLAQNQSSDQTPDEIQSQPSTEVLQNSSAPKNSDVSNQLPPMGANEDPFTVIEGSRSDNVTLEELDASLTFYEAVTQPVEDYVPPRSNIENKMSFPKNQISYHPPHEITTQPSTEFIKEVSEPRNRNALEQSSSLNAKDVAFGAAKVLDLNIKTSETLEDMEKSLNFYEASTQPLPVEYDVSISNEDKNIIDIEQPLEIGKLVSNETEFPAGENSKNIPQISTNKTSETLEDMDKSLNFYEAATQPAEIDKPVSNATEFPAGENSKNAPQICTNKTSETLEDMDKSLIFYEAATQPAEIDKPVSNETEFPAGENSKNTPQICTNKTSETLEDMDKSLNFYEAATQPADIDKQISNVTELPAGENSKNVPKISTKSKKSNLSSTKGTPEASDDNSGQIKNAVNICEVDTDSCSPVTSKESKGKKGKIFQKKNYNIDSLKQNNCDTSSKMSLKTNEPDCKEVTMELTSSTFVNGHHNDEETASLPSDLNSSNITLRDPIDMPISSSTLSEKSLQSSTVKETSDLKGDPTSLEKHNKDIQELLCILSDDTSIEPTEALELDKDSKNTKRKPRNENRLKTIPKKTPSKKVKSQPSAVKMLMSDLNSSQESSFGFTRSSRKNKKFVFVDENTEESSQEIIFNFKKKGCNTFPPDTQEFLENSDSGVTSDYKPSSGVLPKGKRKSPGKSKTNSKYTPGKKSEHDKVKKLSKDIVIKLIKTDSDGTDAKTSHDVPGASEIAQNDDLSPEITPQKITRKCRNIANAETSPNVPEASEVARNDDLSPEITPQKTTRKCRNIANAETSPNVPEASEMAQNDDLSPEITPQKVTRKCRNIPNAKMSPNVPEASKMDQENDSDSSPEITPQKNTRKRKNVPTDLMKTFSVALEELSGGDVKKNKKRGAEVSAIDSQDTLVQKDGLIQENNISSQRNARKSKDISIDLKNITIEIEPLSDEDVKKFKKKGVDVFPPDSQDLLESNLPISRGKIVSKPSGSNPKTPKKKNPLIDGKELFPEKAHVKIHTKGCNISPKIENPSDKDNENERDDNINDPSRTLKASDPRSSDSGGFVSRGNITLHSQEVLEELEEQFRLAAVDMSPTQLSVVSDTEEDNIPDAIETPIKRRSERKRNIQSIYKPLLDSNKELTPEVEEKKKRNVVPTERPSVPSNKTITETKQNESNSVERGDSVASLTRSVKKFKKVTPQKSLISSPVRKSTEKLENVTPEAKTEQSIDIFNDSQNSIDNSEGLDLGRGKRKRTKTSFEGFVTEDLKKPRRKLTDSPLLSITSSENDKSNNKSGKTLVEKNDSPASCSLTDKISCTQNLSVVLHRINKDMPQTHKLGPKNSLLNQVVDDIDDDDLILPPAKSKNVLLKLNKAKSSGVSKKEKDNNFQESQTLNKTQNFSFCDKLDELFNIWGPADRVKLSRRLPEKPNSDTKPRKDQSSDNKKKTSSPAQSSVRSKIKKTALVEKFDEVEKVDEKSLSSKKQTNKNINVSKENKEIKTSIKPLVGLKKNGSPKQKINTVSSEIPVEMRPRRKVNSESDSNCSSKEETLSTKSTRSNKIKTNNSGSTTTQETSISLTEVAAPQKRRRNEKRSGLIQQNLIDDNNKKSQVLSNKSKVGSKNKLKNTETIRLSPPSDDFPENFMMSQEFSFHDTPISKKKPINNELKPPQVDVRRSARSKVPVKKYESRKEKVMFTGISDRKLSALVTDLGGEVVDSPFTCTVLVTDKVKRTTKFLSALSRGLPIVTPEWLHNSHKAGKFSDFDKFLVSDLESESQYSFSLKNSLEKAATRKVLDGWSVFVTSSVKPPPEQIKMIIESGGGKYLAKEPARWPPNSLVISSKSDELNWNRLAKKGKTPPIVSTEALFSGILQQNLDIECHRLI